MTTVQLVQRLKFTNRVVGEQVFCGCGHAFRDDEPKWPMRDKKSDILAYLCCTSCHTLRYPPKEGAD